MKRTLSQILSVQLLARIGVLVFALAIAALLYWGGQYTPVRAGGTYELVMTFPASGLDSEENFGETFAPCVNSGNCAFSCSAANVGRGCNNLVCTGGGNGSSAYFYTHGYECIYTPDTCTPDTSCAASTCTTDTCTATAADCSTYALAGSMSCVVSCTETNACGQSNTGTLSGSTCSVSAPPEVDVCPADPGLQCTGPCAPTCTPDSSCAAGTCPLDTCTATAADCSTYPVNGSNWAACIPSCTPDTSCAASTCNDGSTCTATAADCSTYSIPGTNPAACVSTCSVVTCGAASTICTGDSCTPIASDCSTGATVNGTMSCAATPAVSCSPASQTIAAGGTATFTATPSNGAGPTYTWEDALATVLGTGTPFPKVYAVAGSYAARVKASDGSGGFVYSTYCNVTVTGGACANTGPVTLTASKTRVQEGVPTSVTFTANGSNISGGNCTLSGSGITTQTYVPASCSVTGATYTPTLTLTQQSTYTLTCPGGQFAKVIINIVPKYREF